MIYYFTEEQWGKLWKNDILSSNFDREQTWNAVNQHTKLESWFANELDHWGSITGDEKDITWYLLQL
jgi:hypothetical protein